MRRCFLLLTLLCACSDVGLGPPGGGSPLPASLPAAQTIEGGAQIQVSPAGMTKLVGIVPGIVAAEAERTLCIPQGLILGSNVCFLNQGSCTPGCAFPLDVTSTTVQITNASTVNLRVQGSTSSSVRIDPPIFSACTVTLNVGTFSVDLDVALSIDPASGVLDVAVARINSATTSQVVYSGCPSVAELPQIVDDLLDTLLASISNDAALPAVNAVLAQLAPAPRELAALVDLPALLITGPAATNASLVETRIAPGGYAQLLGGGLSAGVITGFNSDADPATRGAGLESEPDACAADLVAPDLSLPPASLASTPRGSFLLPPEGAFLGMPMPAADLLAGVSRTALDLAGHHMAASGGLCLDLGPEQSAVLRRDALDDLLGLPLDPIDAALRFALRPQSGLRFEIGADEPGSPHLVARFDDLAIDVAAVVGEAAEPALRLVADVGLGLDLVTRREPGLAPRLEPVRASLDVSNPELALFDTRYAALEPALLEALAGTIADVAFAAIGADAPGFRVPGIGGAATNLSLSRVTTASDSFLAIGATIGLAAPPIDTPAPVPVPSAIATAIPAAVDLRAALASGDPDGLPALFVTLPTSDGARPLEHAWRTAGGPWRPWEATGELVIRDRSFAWQGEHAVELRSRVVGDDGTTSEIGFASVLVDYAAPTLFPELASIDTHLVVPARDAAGSALEWALGRVGESEPATAWSSDPNLDLATALALGDPVAVWVRDAAGHAAQAPVAIPEPDAVLAAGLALAALARLRRAKSVR